MTTPAPRDTYRQIAAALAARILADEDLKELPSRLVLMEEFGVSTSVIFRATNYLEKEGLIQRRPGRTSVMTRPDGTLAEKPLVDRFIGVIRSEGLAVGDPFLTQRALCERFGISRMPIRPALDILTARGILSEWSQSKPRRVLRVP